MDEKIRHLLAKGSKIFHITLNHKKVNFIIQFIKFGLVGLTNTIVSYILNIMTLFILSPFQVMWDYIAGNIIAFILSVLWSFYWNNRYVFTKEKGERRSTGKALLRTYISYGITGIIINNILSWVWIERVGISKYIAPLINLVISVPLNFTINKMWAFKAEKN